MSYKTNHDETKLLRGQFHFQENKIYFTILNKKKIKEIMLNFTPQNAYLKIHLQDYGEILNFQLRFSK